MVWNILVLAGDCIGPEVTTEAVKVLQQLAQQAGESLQLQEGLIGGAAIDRTGNPFPQETLHQAQQTDAVLLGAVGGPQWDGGHIRPEQGLLALRAELECFANLRPAVLYPQLVEASSLKADIISGLDILIVRELTGGLYFGEPRGIETRQDGLRYGINTMVYNEAEIKRIAEIALQAAMQRGKQLCSVDKANVLEVSQLWRDVVSQTASSYKEVSLSHMYVDNAAMQLVRDPKQFDVLVTGNIFGDILSDCAAMLTGSIGMLPSASLNHQMSGVYEPVHGSAPDIVGKQQANPLAAILSVAMMCRYTFKRNDLAERLEQAVQQVLEQNLRTPDIAGPSHTLVTTPEMGDAVVAALG